MRVSFVFMVIFSLLLSMSGCAKKKTTIDPMPKEEPVVQAEPVSAPVEDDSFTPVDVDAELRGILQTIYFEFDKYTFSGEEKAKLEKIAPYLSGKPAVRVLVQGHADERGTDDYNMGLGENRAKAVKEFLVGFGIAADRIETVSYGRTKPIEQLCPDETCHSKNRRVEWEVLAK